MNDVPHGAEAQPPAFPLPLKKKGGRPPLLHPTPETLDRVREYALRTANMTDAATAFGVCTDTFAYFLKREGEALAVWKEGQAERIRIRREIAERQLAATAAEMPPPASPPGPGESCPTCGQAVSGPETVTLTQAEIMHAASQFDQLIDRHLAAGKAPRGSRSRKPAGKGKRLP